MMLNARSNYRSPFTATQWQELEHQALIFKYMVSGVPVPPELLYSVKRSLESSLASSRLVFPHQPIGWGCFQAAGSFGRKADPEPGRCRRTDGKKWRCSKEAYPDSKYCERHMHRGRNRSRKPVELIDTNSTTAKNPISNPLESINNIPPVPSNSSYTFSHLSNSSVEPEMYYAHQNQNPSNTNSLLNPFLYPHSSSRPPTSGFLQSGSSSSSSSSRYNFHGMREGVDERALFPDDSRSSTAARRLQDSYQQMVMSNSYRGHSQSQFGSLADTSKQQQQPEQHCFVLGADIKSSSACRPMKLEKDADQTQRPLHHFFDEWQPKDTDSWLDLSSSSRLHSDD